MHRCIHEQLLTLPLQESYSFFRSVWPRSGSSSRHRLDSMCPLWLTRMYMHPFSEEVLCNRLSAFLLCCSPQEACGTVQNQKELLLVHVLDLRVVHEHDVAKVLRSNSREAGSWWSWLRLLADLTVLDHTIIKTVDTFWQVQLACSASELCCAHVIVLQVKLEQFRPSRESLVKFHQWRRHKTCQVQLSLWQNFVFAFWRKR